ncbi:MAG: type IV toxin-antitoxin system AbiEi family antitoxin, partial [Acidimicrobiia bacterium]
AEAAGLSKYQLNRKLRVGEVRRMDRGVYVATACPPSWQQQVLAAVLTAGHEAAASHQSAAYMWELTTRRPRRIEVVVPRGVRRVRDFVVHESTDLIPAHRTLLDGIPVTTPARTVVDLGASAPWLVEPALETGVRAGLFALGGVAETVGDLARRGRNGVGVIRPHIEARLHWDGLTESALEDLFRRRMDEFGFPQPIPQVEIRTPTGLFVCRADFGYVPIRVAFFLDSEAHHMDRLTFRRDREQHNSLELIGWTSLRYTWWDLTARPYLVREQVASVLSSRSGVS